MLWSIAWKNIWRNKLRSLVVIFAVLVGLLAGAFGVAFMSGITKQRTYAMLHNEISHLQIHHPEFQENNESKFFITDSEKVIANLEKNPDVVGLSSRMVIAGMASTSSGSAGGMIYGIDPQKEMQVTEIYKFLMDSTDTYFESDKKNQVLIGEKMAINLKLDRYIVTDQVLSDLTALDFPEEAMEKLTLLNGTKFRSQKDYLQEIRFQIGDELTAEYEYFLLKFARTFQQRSRLVLTFQDKNGEITGGRFRVCGIYKTSNPLYDEVSVFVLKKDLARLTSYPEHTVHEIAVLLSDKYLAQSTAEAMEDSFPGIKVETWGEISPELVMLSEYMGIYNYILIGIILAALAFGIINTMLMAIMERVKELGMLAAIGMNKRRVFYLIMLETIFLSIIGALVALLMNFFIMMRLSETGIDISKSWGQGMESVGYDTLIYPVFGIDNYIGITLMVIVVAIVSSIFPGLKAMRLNPAEAVRSDA